jgi:hypothetical protein
MMDVKVLAVRQKAISVLASVYKTESMEQAAELKGKIQNLLTFIGSDEENLHPDVSPTRTQNSTGPLSIDSSQRVAEIPKPFKRFGERPNHNVGEQVSFLQSAIRERRNR